MQRKDLTKSIIGSQLAQTDVEEPSLAGDFIEDFTAGVSAASIVEEVRVGGEGLKKTIIQNRERRQMYDPEQIRKGENVMRGKLLDFVTNFSDDFAPVKQNERLDNIYNSILDDINNSIQNKYIDVDGNLVQVPFEVNVPGVRNKRKQGQDYLKDIRKRRESINE